MINQIRGAALLLSMAICLPSLVKAIAPESFLDLGTHAVGSSSSQTFSVPVVSTYVDQTLTASLIYGSEFTSTAACVVGEFGCSLTIGFTPKYAGFRQDGIRLTDSQGNVAAMAFLHGTGTGGQMVFGPGMVSIKSPSSPSAPFYNSVVVDPTGTVFFGFQYGVYKLTPGSTQPVLYAGTGTSSGASPGDGGPAINAALEPWSLALDSVGNLFIQEPSDIREVDHTTGIITTLTSGAAYQSGCNAPAGSIFFPSFKTGLATDLTGSVYVLTSTPQVCKFNTLTGTLSIVAGNGTGVFSGDGGPALSAGISNPTAIAVNTSNGDIFIAEGDGRIRRVDFST